MAKKVTKAHCVGCRDNFYNQPGNSDTGKCWSMASATFVKARLVPMSEVPPHTGPIQSVPSCYRKPGYATMKVG